MDEPVMDAYIKKNAVTKRDYLTHKLFPLTRYSDVSINASLRGWRNDFSNYKIGMINIDTGRVAVDDKKFNRPVEMDTGLLRIFEKTIDMITQRGIRVVLVNTPITDILMKANSQNPNEVIRYYQDYAASHELVEYWDFNLEYSTNYKIFYDPIHLNPQGQGLVTRELINRLNRLNF
jgi:hypothetical protein